MAMNLREKGLPKGWKVCALPNFTHVVMGQSPSSSTYNRDCVGLPFFQGKAEFGDTYPQIDKYCSKPNKIANAGATLLCVRAPVGPTNLTKEDVCIGRGLAAIHPCCGIDPKFILFLFRSIEPDLSGKGTGSTFKAITKVFVEELEIALPPFNEQHRIVAKVEQLFSELDKGIESLKTARKQLKVYRQALLKHAFEGKLTEQWRKDNADKLETADQLLTRIQQERDSRYQQQLEKWEVVVKQWEDNEKNGKKPKKPRPLDVSVSDNGLPIEILPEGWAWCKVKDLISDLTDYHANGSYEMLKKHVELKDKPDYALMIRATNFEKNNFLTEQKYIDQNAYEFMAKSKLFGGEILIGKIGNAGRVYYMPKLDRKASLAMNLFCVRFSSISSLYVYYHMLSTFTKKQIASYVKGVGNPTIDKMSIRSINIALPCEAEQKQLIECVEYSMSSIERLEQEINTNIERSEALRQSILKKAFSGQLVPQDPNDEPASELLKRITAEKVEIEARAKAAKAAAKKPLKKKRTGSR